VKVRILGTAAGGGFPQWNCSCRNCDAVRNGTGRLVARREFCCAVSADGVRWFLLESPADVRSQLERTGPFLSIDTARASRIEGILLTGADLDQSLGLLTLREGPPMAVHATADVQNSLAEGLRLSRVLECYAGIDWREPPWELSPLCCRNGESSGLSYFAFSVSGHPPRYIRDRDEGSRGDRVGYVIVDETTRGRLVSLPGVAVLDKIACGWIENCDALLLDGTFWSDDELQRTAAGARSAMEMGHLPIGGPGGSLELVSLLGARRKIYVHINNTNPILFDGSVEYQAVLRAGMEVGCDGLELEL
jgi:pyrroloquinoline quinone biosynthesis protein B